MAISIASRLNELRQLQDGWLEGKGKAPSPAGLDWLLRAFRSNCAVDLPAPCLYPTAEGGVQAEWSLGAIEISLDIDLETHRGYWHELNLDTRDDASMQYDLDTWEAWQEIASRVERFQGVSHVYADRRELQTGGFLATD